MPRPRSRAIGRKRVAASKTSFTPTALSVEPGDLAREGDVKLTKGRFPHTPTKLFRGRHAWDLTGVSKSKATARRIALKSKAQGWRVGIAKTPDGFVVYSAT